MGKLLVLDLLTSSLSTSNLANLLLDSSVLSIKSNIRSSHAAPRDGYGTWTPAPLPPFFPACRPYRSGAPLVLTVGRAVRTYMSLERGAEPANTTQPGRASFPVASM